MAEPIEVDIVVSDTKLVQGFKQAEILARDTKKVLDKELLFNLQLNVANLQLQLDAARKELRKTKEQGDKDLILKAQLDVNSLSSNLTEAKRQLNNYVNTGDKDLSRLQAKFNQISSDIKGGFTTALKSAGSALNSVLGAVGLGAGIAGFGALSKQVITLAGNLEQARIAFTTMIGSAQQADKLLRELSDFAKRTPFELVGLRDQAKLLLAYGFEADEVVKTLDNLGNIAAGVGVDKLPRLVYALGQVRAAGRLTGQDLRQFTETGVPLLEELSKVTGIATQDMVGNIGDLKISYEQVQEALNNLTGEGGKFTGLMEAQSQTFQGTISNFQDNLNALAETIGMRFLPPLTEAVQWLNRLFSPDEENQLKARLQDITGELGSLSKVQRQVQQEAKDLQLQFSNGEISAEKYAEGMSSLSAQNRILQADKKKLNAEEEKYQYLVDQSTNFTEVYANEVDKLNNQIASLNQQIQKNQKDLNDGTITQDEYNKNIEDLRKELAAAQNLLATYGGAMDDVRIVTDILANSTLSAAEQKEFFNKIKVDNSATLGALSAEQRQLQNLSAEYIRVQRLKIIALAGEISAQASKRANDPVGAALGLIGDTKEQEEQLQIMQNNVKQAEKILKEGVDISPINAAVEKANDATNKGTTATTKASGDAAKKQLEIKEKQLEDQARLDIKAAKEGEGTEAEKAQRVLDILKKLDEDKNTLRGDDLENEQKNAKAILDSQESLLDERAKQEIASIKKSETNEQARASKIQAVLTKLEEDKDALRGDWVEKEKEAIKEVEDRYEDIEEAGVTAFESINEAIEDSADKIKELKDDLDDVNDKLQDIQQDLASRVLELEEDLAKAREKLLSTDDLKERQKIQEEIAKMEEELNLARANVTQEALDEAKKTETQRLLDKKAELEARKTELETQLAQEIEFQQTLQDAKLKLEEDFTKNYGVELQKQTDLLKAAIAERIAQYRALQAAKEAASENLNAQPAGGNTTNNTFNQNINNPVDAAWVVDQVIGKQNVQ